MFVRLLVLLLSARVATSVHVEYTSGTLPIIISAPHGGSDKPANFADREDGCYVNKACSYVKGCSPKSSKCDIGTSRDSYTNELAHQLSDALFVLTGERPHLIECHVHRSKLDVNREIEEGAQGDANAIIAYNQYFTYVDQARSAVGTGLLLDLHGQTHSENWVELGYLVTKTRLDGKKNQSPLAKYSSIKELDSTASASFEDLLRGSTSLGGRLQAAGYRAIPSPADPGPNGGGYFSGGHITRYYGSRYSGSVDAIQVESPSSLRFNTTLRAKYATDLAAAVNLFFPDHYGTNL